MATAVQPLLPKDGVDEAVYRETESTEALKAIYGDDFPHAQIEGEGSFDLEDSSWLSWARGRWAIHGPAVRPRLHMVERNRLVALGVQYISSTDGRTWSEPRKRRDEARIVHNVIEPALDQRQQVVNENRPGFKTRPTRREPDFLKRAEAQQLALENQYDQQKMAEVRKVATYWALRDGVSFVEQYWDPDRGPWHQGGEGTMGELCNRVHRIEHVRVAANASTIEDPYYWVIKRRIPLQSAVATYGEAVVDRQREARADADDEMISIRAYRRLGMELPGEDPLLEEIETVNELTVYCAPHGKYLPEGLVVKCVGDAVVYIGPLPPGVPPMIRWTDGSTDPSFYPKAVMEQWIDDQMRLNQILSRWVERVRRDGGTLLARANALGRETMVTGGMTVVEVNGGVQLDQVVYPIKPIPLSGEAKELWAITLKSFEDKSGYNDQSRGTFSAEQSGRSILAQRETLERIFAPTVNAAAQAMKDWAKVTLHGMKAWWDEPRTMASMGAGRPDLGRAITADDFDGICDVEIDPETLMPMPRSLKLFHLDQLYDRKIIDAGEYRRRYPFAFVQDIQTPDGDHLARAKRIAEALIRKENPPPIRWQDNEAIHQDVLERDIILRDDLPEEVVMAAHGRWLFLAEQSQLKMGGMMPPPPAPSLGGGGGGFGGPALLPPTKQPLLGTSPSVAAAPVRDIAMGQDQELAASQFDAIQPT